MYSRRTKTPTSDLPTRDRLIVPAMTFFGQTGYLKHFSYGHRLFADATPKQLHEGHIDGTVGLAVAGLIVGALAKPISLCQSLHRCRARYRLIAVRTSGFCPRCGVSGYGCVDLAKHPKARMPSSSGIF
jgi:hypothetical protein